jgi:hypothetical protein
MTSLLRSILIFLLAVAAVVVLLPLGAIGAWIAYWKLVPAYSASMAVTDLQTTLTLRFYYIWDENSDHGRYLRVSGPNGSTTVAMTAFDWAHNGRTSIYVTPRKQIAIVGPIGDDYLVSLDPPRTDPAREPSDDWTYLGAFDFEGAPGVGRQLGFISAEQQAECIPMRGGRALDLNVRKAARQEDCGHHIKNK